MYGKVKSEYFLSSRISSFIRFHISILWHPILFSKTFLKTHRFRSENRDENFVAIFWKYFKIEKKTSEVQMTQTITDKSPLKSFLISVPAFKTQIILISIDLFGIIIIIVF